MLPLLPSVSGVHPGLLRRYFQPSCLGHVVGVIGWIFGEPGDAVHQCTGYSLRVVTESNLCRKEKEAGLGRGRSQVAQ